MTCRSQSGVPGRAAVGVVSMAGGDEARLVGGHDNFAIDRAAALAVSEAAPEVRPRALENRKFLRRTVRYLA